VHPGTVTIVLALPRGFGATPRPRVLW
jgi:hypothetical protein